MENEDDQPAITMALLRKVLRDDGVLVDGLTDEEILEALRFLGSTNMN